MRICTDCGGDVGKGWTNPSDHDHCASCDIARALGSPIPERRTGLTYWQLYYQHRKALRWKAARDGR